MEELEFVAILDQSTGNDVAGESWQETKVFSWKATLGDVMSWASKRHGDGDPEYFKGHLSITVKQ